MPPIYYGFRQVGPTTFTFDAIATVRAPDGSHAVDAVSCEGEVALGQGGAPEIGPGSFVCSGRVASLIRSALAAGQGRVQVDISQSDAPTLRAVVAKAAPMDPSIEGGMPLEVRFNPLAAEPATSESWRSRPPML